MELLNVPAIGAVNDAKALLLDGVTVKSATCTSAGRALIAGASNVEQRESLGLGAVSVLNTIGLSTSFASGILPIAKGGTGTSSGLPYGSVKDLTYPSILGRKTNTTGNAELLSVSDVLDMVGTTHGSILYRGSSGWFELQPGSPGQVLRTGGPNANPTWISVSSGSAGKVVSLQFSSPTDWLGVGLQPDPPSDAFPFGGHPSQFKLYTLHRVPFVPTSFQMALVMTDTLESLSPPNPNPIPNPVGLRLQYSTNGSTWSDATVWDLRTLYGYQYITGSLSISSASAVYFRISSYNLNPNVTISIRVMNLSVMLWN